MTQQKILIESPKEKGKMRKKVLIVLNYNDFETTEAFLVKVMQMECFNKIVVVDNCSTDESFRRLKKYESELIDVIQTTRNGGYAYGNNFGSIYAIRNYSPDIIFISNPDVEFEKKVVDKMEEEIINDDEIGVIAPVVNQGYNIWTLPEYWGVIESIFLIWHNLKKKKEKTRVTKSTKMVEEVGNLYKSYKYILVGSVAVGKSTALSHFRSISTQDEWLDSMPEKMAKDPSKVADEEIMDIDHWIADQWGKKNFKLLRIKEGLHIVDRGPLDAFAFTPKGEWMSKAKLTKEHISPENSNRKLCPAQIIVLIGDPPTMASRAILSQKDTDAKKLEKQQELIKHIYSLAPHGVVTIDTRNKGKSQVAKEIAKVIFMKDYCEAPLDDILQGILDGRTTEPVELLG